MFFASWTDWSFTGPRGPVNWTYGTSRSRKLDLRDLEVQFIRAKNIGGSQNSSRTSRDNSPPTRRPSIVCVVYLKAIFKNQELIFSTVVLIVVSDMYLEKNRFLTILNPSTTPNATVVFSKLSLSDL